jgi:hypothetical protein
MKLAPFGRAAVFAALFVFTAVPLFAQTSMSNSVRITGSVRDDKNAIPLPGVPVEADSGQTAYTDVDGRYVVDVAPGTHQLTVTLDGYQTKTSSRASNERVINPISRSSRPDCRECDGHRPIIDVPTSTAEAQLIERRQAQVITDNLGSQEMKRGDPTPPAMARVTGLSLVDNQYLCARSRQRYSNTTLAGSVIPTPDPTKVVRSTSSRQA